jgi:hypothetical protein
VIWRALAFLRSQLLLILFGLLIYMQFLTWRELNKLRYDLPSSPPECDYRHPCYVIITQP